MPDVLRRHLTEVGTEIAGFLRVRGRARSSAMGGLDLTGFGIAEFSPQLNLLGNALGPVSRRPPIVPIFKREF